MGLLSVTSDNPDFKRSIPDALAVAPDMQVDSPRPRIVTGPTVADANHRQLGPPNTGDDDFFLDLESGIAVFEILKATVDHPNGNKKQDPFFGFGRVDATPVDVH